MGAVGDPLLAFVVPGTICGEPAALAVVMAGSDLRPSEYPNAKNTAQIPTRPKNRNSNLPVPSVISVSCEDAIAQRPYKIVAQVSAASALAAIEAWTLCRLRGRRRPVSAAQQLLQPREKV